MLLKVIMWVNFLCFLVGVIVGIFIMLLLNANEPLLNEQIEDMK